MSSKNLTDPDTEKDHAMIQNIFNDEKYIFDTEMVTFYLDIFM